LKTGVGYCWVTHKKTTTPAVGEIYDFLLAFVGEIYDFLTTLNEGEQIFHGNQLALAAAALSCHGHPACKKQTILRNSA
jgi:hypothetical protein